MSITGWTEDPDPCVDTAMSELDGMARSSHTVPRATRCPRPFPPGCGPRCVSVDVLISVFLPELRPLEQQFRPQPGVTSAHLGCSVTASEPVSQCGLDVHNPGPPSKGQGP